jgi:eukaryotic-like serine/threonine-protein kinase
MTSTRRHVPVDTGGSVGRYVLGRRLGAGGMGAVYEATVDGKQFAIKLPYCETLENQYASRRFQDEGIAGSIVDHPNLARVFEHGEANGIPYIVMEQVTGEPLCVRSAISPRRAAVIVRQLLDGLDALHAAGIVHADVKSDNVLITRTEDGREIAKLIDFGLAHPELESAPARPAKNEETVSGTPDYMAPEVIRGKGSSPASDIYAAGVILYELLTGTTPFGGGSSSEIVHRHLCAPVVPPSLRREIPPILERIVMRALQKNPQNRFASAGAFAAALAVAIPSLCDDDIPVTELSSEKPTLEWPAREALEEPPRRRIARGTPAARRRSKR